MNNKRGRLKESLLLEILKYLDTNTLQKARFTSRLINRLIMDNLILFNAQLEMVQLRYNNDMFSCKCLPYRDKPQEAKFQDINMAIQYLKTLMHNTSIRLLNIQYITLTDQTLDLLGTLSAGSISDVSITGCNFKDTNPKTFRDVFIEGNLKAERYTISYSKNVSDQMFDNDFMASLLGRKIKMVTLHFCSFIESDRRFLPISCNKFIEWFFDESSPLEYRVLSIADIKLDTDFADRLIKAFQLKDNIKPTTMVISGEVEQNAEQTNSIELQYFTGPMPERRVTHKNGKYFFKFGRVSPDRVEFSLLKMSDDNLGVDTKRARRSMNNDYPPKC